MTEVVGKIEQLIEIAKLYRDRGDLHVAIPKLEEAAADLYAQRNFDLYLECCNYLLRMYAETLQHDKIQETKERLQDLVIKENFELSAKTYRVLGFCTIHKGQDEVALDYFHKSLQLALAEDNKVDICHAIYGLASSYHNLGMFQEALKEIYNLEVFFQVLSLPELKLASQILNANILRKLKRYDKALEILWGCYDSLRENKNMYLYFFVLFCIGKVYKEHGELQMARMYLELVRRSVDGTNFAWLAKEIQSQLNELGVPNGSTFDLVFDRATNSVQEKKKGKVDFKNQFILMDMLHLFMKNPGQVFSKEELVKEIWRQEYDPAIHDNKIYVTIKRLRKLIEPDYEKPRYIFRAKNGYYLNKNTSILLENDHTPAGGI